MGFAQTQILVKASFIAKVHTVHAVDAGFRVRHIDVFSPDMAFSKSKFHS